MLQRNLVFKRTPEIWVTLSALRLDKLIQPTVTYCV